MLLVCKQQKEKSEANSIPNVELAGHSCSFHFGGLAFAKTNAKYV